MHDHAARGTDLIIKTGNMIAVLETIHAKTPITAIHSHEETGNAWIFARDIAVGKWCKAQNIAWHEYQNFGVKRPLKTRDNWAAQWEAFMNQPQSDAPAQLSKLNSVESEELPDAAALGLPADPCPGRQIGGRRAAFTMFGSFFEGRGKNYQKEMSSPLSVAEACSRQSPPIAHGSRKGAGRGKRSFPKQDRIIKKDDGQMKLDL